MMFNSMYMRMDNMSNDMAINKSRLIRVKVNFKDMFIGQQEESREWKLALFLQNFFRKSVAAL